jgi:zinc transport system substrate-binding protein
MYGTGTPQLIIPAGSSPHGYAMRPSQARAVQSADVVFWIGEDLTPWFEERLETLAPNAVTSELLHVDGTELLAFRQGVAFEAHDDDHGDEHEDEHGDEDAHDEHDEHDENEAHDDDHDAHDHDGVDPHAWLSPNNAKLWLDHIAQTLLTSDPENAALYQENAETAKAAIDVAVDGIKAKLVGDAGAFIVFHDAYQYFETSFGLTASAAVSLGDAAAPGPARIREIHELVQQGDVVCAFSEPQFNQRLLETVLEGTEAKIAVLDPLGTEISEGRDFYPMLLTSMGNAMAGCITP